MATKIWTKDKTVEEALDLPEGRIAADIGFLVQQSVRPDLVLEAAQAFKDSSNEVTVTVASQAALLVKAQEAGLALQDWGKLVLV